MTKKNTYKTFVIINGTKYYYTECSCDKFFHKHNIDCLTQAMIDALSEEAYGTNA